MKKSVIFLLLLVSISVLKAEILTGVVDLERIFREYYKSKIAEELIKQQAQIYRNYLSRLESEQRPARQELPRRILPFLPLKDRRPKKRLLPLQDLWLPKRLKLNFMPVNGPWICGPFRAKNGRKS